MDNWYYYLIAAAVILVYFVLMRWVLPRFGVSTWIAASCEIEKRDKTAVGGKKDESNDSEGRV